MQYITCTPLPRKKHLKLSKCNWFERELGKANVFSGTQKTHIVKSWFLQAQSLEMCEWFQLFQWDVFVFLKIMCATLAIQSQVLGTSSQDCEVFCQCQQLGFTCTHCFDQWIKSPLGHFYSSSIHLYLALHFGKLARNSTTKEHLT